MYGGGCARQEDERFVLLRHGDVVVWSRCRRPKVGLQPIQRALRGTVDRHAIVQSTSDRQTDIRRIRMVCAF
jgi:hypothetical protein